MPVLRLILRELKRLSLVSEGLLVGRQTVLLTYEKARRLIREEGLDNP